MPKKTTEDEARELGVSAAKSGTIYVGGEIATSVVTLVLLIFLARILQPAAFGLYTIAVSFNALLGIASNFGVGTAFRKMLPEMKKSDKKGMSAILTNGYAIVFVLGLIIAIFGIAISGWLGINIYGNSSLVLALEIAAGAVLFSVLFNLTQGALVGLGMVNEAVWANVVYSVIYLVASVGLVLLGYGVNGAVSGLFIGVFLGTIYGLYFVIRNVGFSVSSLSRKVSKRLTDFSIPVVTSYVAMQGTQSFSILLLGVFAATTVVGNFGAAYKFARFVEIIITSITFILVGTFSAALAKKKLAERIGGIYNKSLFYGGLFLFPIIAYSVSVSQPVTNLLFSSQYTLTPLYFAIIVVGMALGIVGSFAGTLIISKGDVKKFMKYQVGAVIVQLILLFILTPTYQALGVMAALYVITPIMLNILYMRALEAQFKFKHQFRKLGMVALVSIFMTLIMLSLAGYLNQTKWLLVINGIVMIALFPPLAGMTGAVDREDLSFVERLGNRLGPVKHATDMLVRYTAFFTCKEKMNV